MGLQRIALVIKEGNQMKRKCLAVGIILLFVGVTIAPTINFNTVKASTEDDLIEVTTQACGIQGYGNTTVRLTREQYNDLEQYLVEFRARLNQTSTREEAIPLFKDAIEELNKYGLLPKGMSTEQAQYVVTGRSHNPRMNTLIRDILKKKNLNDSANILCFITGHSTYTEIVTLFQRILSFGFLSILGLLVNLPLPIYLFFAIVLLGITMVFFALGYLRPMVLWSDIYIHGGDCSLFSLGLGGYKNWVGNFSGYIHGFTGFKLLLDLETPIEFFYIGFALQVEMNPYTPVSKEFI
jgi:hypothetical protein